MGADTTASLRVRTAEVTENLRDIANQEFEAVDVRTVCSDAQQVIAELLGQIDELIYWAYEGVLCEENKGTLMSENMQSKLNLGHFFGSRK